ncbi:uncharacterized protein FIBRA_02514 [Fibroporia radiculosa]|uniref:Clathrin/coatomer adaptor adaptin-like N-terminal domain-containing protein n=1 Tax=Fibroporia radiculosa TaxID=599839 RepID=J4GMX7_9APHY|nr:uncharacterized protein FIBRA_02514 [Fibroporia radiculosa]CCM00480.1 predicted protein [Fibroporia radiculosa]
MSLDFAFAHAVNLAEAGTTVKDKRIGYLFCSELMPPNHELQLMLVNTLRKDLESAAVPRICLALDSLIQFSTEDVIPAIQARLADLVSHSSPHIRRRALFVFHKLSKHDGNILKMVMGKIPARLKDSDPLVASAGLTVCVDLAQTSIYTLEYYHTLLSKLLTSSWSDDVKSTTSLLLNKLLKALHTFSLSQDNLRTILQILRMSSQGRLSGNGVLYQCFLSLLNTSTEKLLLAQTSFGVTFVSAIRSLLTSNKPNDVYIFLSCLECLDPQLWAGTKVGTPAVLEEWEVEKVMTLLNLDDQYIRRKTLRILQRIDPGLVEGYYSRKLESISLTVSQDIDGLSARLLEIIGVMSGEDGETYAQHAQSMLLVVQQEADLEQRPILQDTVEVILTKIQNARIDFRSGCIGVFFSRLVETGVPIVSTMMVVLAALVAEFLNVCAISPVKLMEAFAERVSLYPASIQDVILLCIMRIAAECDEIPLKVIENVRSLHGRSGRYIRRRCDQFLKFLTHKGAFKDVLTAARSSSLPDFLAALDIHEAVTRTIETRSQSRHSSTSQERSMPRSNKLRYDAYEAPKLPHRRRRLSSGGISHVSDDNNSGFLGQDRDSPDRLARIVTPGDLAIAAGERDLEALSIGSPLPTVPSLDEDDSATRVDLIALDSPFMSEPAPSTSTASNTAETEFESIWDSLQNFNARGWCEMSVTDVVQRLRSMQQNVRVILDIQEPFRGETKVIISRTSDLNITDNNAVLRLKTNDDESCLWQLRCRDESLRFGVKELLSET